MANLFETKRAASTLTSLNMVRSPYSLRQMSLVLLGLLGLIIVGLIFVPWQQTVTAPGQVTVFSPMERPQTVNAQIDGRLVRWLVKEGDHIEQGQLLAELQDIKPEYLDPAIMSRYESQREMYLAKKQATQSLINVLDHQAASVTSVRTASVSSAGLQIKQAQDRIDASRQSVKAAEQNLVTARFNLERRKRLFEEGLRSKRDLEVAENEAIKAATDLESAKSQLHVVQQGGVISEFDQSRISADAMAKIQDIQAKRAESMDKLATIGSEIAKLEIDIANLKQRMSQKWVQSPRSGQLVRMFSIGPGQTVKAGEPLAVIAPETRDQAVELYVSDHDAPLVTVGTQVRLQFAGWPALQFTGWPSVAVGTFAGRVVVIDDAETQEKKGFRVLVKPDLLAVKSGQDQPWPKPKYLRPGSNARGWLLLNEVPLGFELWRQFNGFPPALQPSEDISKAKMELKRKK